MLPVKSPLESLIDKEEERSRVGDNSNEGNEEHEDSLHEILKHVIEEFAGNTEWSPS